MNSQQYGVEDAPIDGQMYFLVGIIGRQSMRYTPSLGERTSTSCIYSRRRCLQVSARLA